MMPTVKFNSFITILTICIFSCNVETRDFPYLIRNYPDVDSVKNIEKYSSSYYKPIYIGKQADTIDLNKVNDTTLKYLKSVNLNKYAQPTRLNLSIKLDTSQIITYENQGKYYKAFPLFLKNISNDTLDVSSDKYFPIYIEAKNTFNKWESIECIYLLMDEIGYYKKILLPKNIIIIPIPILTGNKKHKLRIVYDRYSFFTSDEFYGYINEDLLLR